MAKEREQKSKKRGTAAAGLGGRGKRKQGNGDREGGKRFIDGGEGGCTVTTLNR